MYVCIQCNKLQLIATHCNTPQQAVDELIANASVPVVNALQHTATHCNTLQHTATHCNLLQHTAT